MFFDTQIGDKIRTKLAVVILWQKDSGGSFIAYTLYLTEMWILYCLVLRVLSEGAIKILSTVQGAVDNMYKLLSPPL